MGWRCTVQADKPIKQRDLDKVMEGMPGLFGKASKQEWGWSAVVDVWNVEDGRIYVGGAGFSVGSLDGFLRALRIRMCDLGYKSLRRGRVSC